MPGKTENANSYSYMTALALLRTLSAADTATQVGIEAVAEEVDLSVDENSENISVGRENRLVLGVLLPAGISAADVKVYVDMADSLSVSNKWALVHAETIAFSTQIVLDDIYPGVVKVLITSITGAGTVEITYSRSR